MPAVFNASPLIHLMRLTKMKDVSEFHAQLRVPKSVYREVVEMGKKEGYADAFLIEKMQTDGALLVERLNTEAEKIADELEKVVGEGEGEAIALARQLRLPLVMDDEHGRRIARYYDVETTTTLGVILQLALAKRIKAEEYSANVTRYGSMGWITSDVLERFLGEARNLE